MNSESVQKTIVTFLQKNIGERTAIIGLSGGVDSALVVYLAREALGAERVVAVLMPSSSNVPDDLRLAQQVAGALAISYDQVDIDPMVAVFTKQVAFPGDNKALGNLKARIRMNVLYGYADKIEQEKGLKGVVLGTGNKSEIMTGYTTKHGDAACDILPIGDLYKTQVWELAKNMGIPDEIIKRPPTAGLWEGQTDEGELGIKYQTLDAILEALESNKNLSPFSQKEIELVEGYINRSMHKRNLPPICKFASTS